MSNTRPDAGVDALLALEDAAVLPITNFNEDAPHMAEGVWSGDTEAEIGQGNEFTARPDAGGATKT